MKKILMAAVAITAIYATPAMSNTVSYDVTGTVGATCSALPAKSAANTVKFGTIGTDLAGKAVATAATSFDITFFCNGSNASVAYSADNAGKMTNAAGANNSTYTNVITFSPDVKYNAAAFTSGGTVTSGTLTIGANSNATTLIASSGDYLGAISVTLTPGS